MDISMERVYESPDPGAGQRVLVDRLWPRGVSKERADLDLWAKEATPSTELRHRWHEPGATDTAAGRELLAAALRAELESGQQAVAFAELLAFVRKADAVVLLTASKIIERSHVPVIRALLLERLTDSESPRSAPRRR
ncbi:DUF488 family protein [Leucobacter sp. CSA2]|uniref:DUF488 family protein n=1 Tax=Leucobacter edaphi TaxID=2796472 RepID=A0A934QA49_9MICO|nr:DUF488 family protein [Leucobacter edaphi]MBK0420975.1 DUF488 family protein [Leucobacter edaphi]